MWANNSLRVAVSDNPAGAEPSFVTACGGGACIYVYDSELASAQAITGSVVSIDNMVALNNSVQCLGTPSPAVDCFGDGGGIAIVIDAPGSNSTVSVRNVESRYNNASGVCAALP